MLQTERLILRRPEPDDLATWQDYFLSERACHLGGGLSVGSGLAWRVFSSFLGHWELNGCGPFVMSLLAKNERIGLVGPWYPSNWPEKEISWSIWNADFEGHGYAFEAASAVRKHVFVDLNWQTAVSYIDQSNTRSIALAERLGCYQDTEADTPDGESVLVYRHKTDDEFGHL